MWTCYGKEPSIWAKGGTTAGQERGDRRPVLPLPLCSRTELEKT